MSGEGAVCFLFYFLHRIFDLLFHVIFVICHFVILTVINILMFDL
jgi:hypothetical protein